MTFRTARCSFIKTARGERPTKARCCLPELPSHGGNTLLSEPAAVKHLAEAFAIAVELDIRFNFDNETTIRSSAWRTDIPDYTHPLVVAHPETGEPVLFCNRLMADAIVGVSPAESAALIAELCAHMERPDNVYEHVWQLGDFVIWDNVATAHGRTDFDRNERRPLRRTRSPSADRLPRQVRETAQRAAEPPLAIPLSRRHVAVRHLVAPGTRVNAAGRALPARRATI